MKKAFAAFLIGVICLAVLGAHAWKTWGETALPPAAPQSDREFVEYSLFLESFAFMVSAAYFFGPKIYRLFGEEAAAVKFAGERAGVSRVVHIYAAAAVILRRLWFDQRIGVSPIETLLVISVISTPVVLSFIGLKHGSQKKTV